MNEQIQTAMHAGFKYHIGFKYRSFPCVKYNLFGHLPVMIPTLISGLSFG